MSTVHQQFEASLATTPRAELAMQVQPTPSTSPMALIHMAVSSGMGMDVINGLVKLQREEREYHAELEFNAAMQRAQGKMRCIGVDATNPQTRSKYATYAKLDAAVRPIYTDEGFSLSFNTTESPVADCIRVLCYVSHKGGYTRTYQTDMPADGKGAKGGDVMTKTHASGSAMSYGMRYLLKMIFNVAVGETDNDGNGAGGNKGMDADEFERLSSLLEEARSFEVAKKVFGEAYRACESARDDKAKGKFIAAYEKKKKDLL